MSHHPSFLVGQFSQQNNSFAVFSLEKSSGELSAALSPQDYMSHSSCLSFLRLRGIAFKALGLFSGGFPAKRYSAAVYGYCKNYGHSRRYKSIGCLVFKALFIRKLLLSSIPIDICHASSTNESAEEKQNPLETENHDRLPVRRGVLATILCRNCRIRSRSVWDRQLLFGLMK